jgi:hypothetical protein
MGSASRLFNGTAEQTLIGRVTPTTAQREFLQVQWNTLAEFLKRDLEERHQYPISTWLQGSYKFGTLIKPLHAGEEYDVDVGVYFEWGKEDAEPTSQQLRTWTQASLIRFAAENADVREIADPPKQRCSRAIYAEQFHIDTPVYHLDKERDLRRLACLPDEWEFRDPKPIYKWFKSVVSDSDRDQLRRLVRYLKGWAALAFDGVEDSRPSSVFLTVVVSEAFAGIWLDRLAGIADDDALVAVVAGVHGRCFNDKRVWNPVDASEDLNRISDEDWPGFLTRLEALQDTARRADACEDEATAAIVWSEALSFLMPLPEANQVEVVDQESGRALMQLPDVDIDVYSRNPRRFLTRHRNEVPGVAKHCDLLFSIANPFVIPEFSMVEWTVRNEGQEADQRSDLGHRRMGMKLLEAEESTAYAGRHFMDCVVRLAGSVYAVRRVPVNVRDVLHQPVAAARPAYVKLQSFRRRK